MKEEKIVWATGVLWGSTVSFGFRSDTHMDDHPDQEETFKQYDLIAEGKPVDETWIPKSMWASYLIKPGRLKKVPKLHLFSPAGYWAVSKKFGDLLRQFQLGQTKFYPLELLHHDKETPVEGDYEYLNICEHKSAFEPDQSKNHDTDKFPSGRPLYTMTNVVKDYDLVLNDEACDGADVWLDPNLHSVLFLSGEIVKALKASGFSKQLELVKCRVL
ncbi:MAG: DUF1629 domain-containing protein [Litoreibacter sp.]